MPSARDHRPQEGPDAQHPANAAGKTSRTFRICARTMDAIERMAKAENRTVNNMVETILKRHLGKPKPDPHP